jgi:hypothetical protein
MGSRERLWGIFGPAWAWPKETMTYEQDRADLLRHEKEIAAHQSARRDSSKGPGTCCACLRQPGNLRRSSLSDV